MMVSLDVTVEFSTIVGVQMMESMIFLNDNLIGYLRALKICIDASPEFHFQICVLRK